MAVEIGVAYETVYRWTKNGLRSWGTRPTQVSATEARRYYAEQTPRGRSAERAKVSSVLYAAGKTIDEIADEVGASSGSVFLDITKREPTTIRPRGVALKRLRAQQTAVFHEIWVSEAPRGLCGTVGCTDPACDLEHGRCHAPGCRRRTSKARQSRKDARHPLVRGEHQLFCSSGHSCRGRHTRLRVECGKCGKALLRQPYRVRRSMSHYCSSCDSRRARPTSRAISESLSLFYASELGLAWKLRQGRLASAQWQDPTGRADKLRGMAHSLYKRYGSTKMFGRHWQLFPRRRHPRPGMPEDSPRRKLTAEKRQRVKRMREEKKSLRAIAAATGLTMGSVRHVLSKPEDPPGY